LSKKIDFKCDICGKKADAREENFSSAETCRRNVELMDWGAEGVSYQKNEYDLCLKCYDKLKVMLFKFKESKGK